MIKAKMKTTLKTILIISLLSLTACDQYAARHFGGTMTVEIEKDQKFMNCSWKSKDGPLWILTRARKDGEQAETYKYYEKSLYGVMEGTVLIQEK